MNFFSISHSFLVLLVSFLKFRTARKFIICARQPTISLTISYETQIYCSEKFAVCDMIDGIRIEKFQRNSFSKNFIIKFFKVWNSLFVDESTYRFSNLKRVLPKLRSQGLRFNIKIYNGNRGQKFKSF